MNLVLSSLPQLQEVLGVDYHATQSLLTIFLAGAALGQLGAGRWPTRVTAGRCFALPSASSSRAAQRQRSLRH